MKTHFHSGLFFIAAGISAIFVASFALLSRAHEESQLEELQPEQDCGPYAHWDPVVRRCHRDSIPPDSELNVPPPKLIPPPQGVIVLKPGGVQEQADSCPEGFREDIGLNGWRFCVDPKHPEPLPPLAVPPIAGIPYQRALDIIERNHAWLGALPGVDAVGLSPEGIVVHTDSPDLVPKEIEGLPVIVRPPVGPVRTMGHTRTRRVRPIHGGALIIDAKNIDTAPSRYGTLSVVGLSQGEPYLLFPSHLMEECEKASPCPPDSSRPLNSTCPRNTIIPPSTSHAGTQQVYQPPQTSNRQRVGFLQRWHQLMPDTAPTYSLDGAVAFMDTDTTEGNNSLCANRQLESYGNFSGSEGNASYGLPVTVVTGLDPHQLSGVITSTFIALNRVFSGCINPPNQYTKLTYMIQIEVPEGFCFTNGDSGAAVLDSAQVG